MNQVNSAIAVKDLYFEWNESTPILSACSLEVPRGEFWMLLGNNGSGKSTLLRLLAGLLTPQSGEIRLDDPLGFVFQNPDHQLVMPTVGADVAFGLVKEKLSIPEVRARVGEALTAVNLLEMERRPIYALSGGQKQRIGIARALYSSPSILFLDESTSSLDVQTEQEIVNNILVNMRNITRVVIAHRISTIRSADRIAYLENGLVASIGTYDELKEQISGFGSD
jgi:energy-coupling factor transport system ATP-binding protein